MIGSLVETSVNEVTDFLVHGGVVDSNRKVVDLAQAQKENRVTIDNASIDAVLVGGRDKTQVLQDGCNVTFSETRGFGMVF
jgi:nickel-dependent lactate racemase